MTVATCCVAAALGAVVGSCAVPAAVPAAASPSGIASAPGTPEPAGLVPAGRGTLHQDDFTIALRSGALQIKVTPLAEEVIRLAAPDTYERLHTLAESRRGAAAPAGGPGAPGLFLVSFFSYEPDLLFQPEDLQLIHQGRTHRALAVIPITPGWGAQRLMQQESQTAIYVFDAGIDLEQSLTLRYDLDRSDQWDRILPRLQVERAKVRARAGSSDQAGMSYSLSFR